MRKDIILHLHRRLVAGDLVEALLEIDDKEGGVVLVDALVREGRCCRVKSDFSEREGQ